MKHARTAFSPQDGPVKLGIDFGTTRIVVAHADRGNYPLVTFEGVGDSSGDSFEWFPDMAALRVTDDEVERRFGWDAWNAQAEPGWTIIRSLKRYLEDAGPETRIEAAEVSVRLADMMHDMVA